MASSRLECRKRGPAYRIFEAVGPQISSPRHQTRKLTKGTDMSLAEQSLGLDSGSQGPVTLQEKRKQYDEWLKAGRRTDRPNPALYVRTDEGPGEPVLVARREQAHTDSAAKLLH